MFFFLKEVVRSLTHPEHLLIYFYALLRINITISKQATFSRPDAKKYTITHISNVIVNGNVS